MNIISVYVFKTVIHIGIVSILFISNIRSVLFYIFAGILILYNVLPVILYIRKSREYKRRYTRKKYHMSLVYYTGFNLIEFLLMMVVAYPVFSAEKIKIENGILIALHFIMVAGLNLTRTAPIYGQKKAHSNGLENKMVQGSVIENGRCVLKKGENVQLLNVFDGRALVRKSNGEEFVISENMLLSFESAESSAASLEKSKCTN
ncbi:hypothetical protein GVAV_000464 [Gurleya vavrai]